MTVVIEDRERAILSLTIALVIHAVIFFLVPAEFTSPFQEYRAPLYVQLEPIPSQQTPAPQPVVNPVEPIQEQPATDQEQPAADRLRTDAGTGGATSGSAQVPATPVTPAVPPASTAPAGRSPAAAAATPSAPRAESTAARPPAAIQPAPAAVRPAAATPPAPVPLPTAATTRPAPVPVQPAVATPSTTPAATPSAPPASPQAPVSTVDLATVLQELSSPQESTTRMVEDVYQFQQEYSRLLETYQDRVADSGPTAQETAAVDRTRNLLTRRISDLQQAITRNRSNLVTLDTGDPDSPSSATGPASTPSSAAGTDGSGITVDGPGGTRTRLDHRRLDVSDLSFPSYFPPEMVTQIDFTVDRNGDVIRAEVLFPTGSDQLDARLRNYVMTWQYESASGSHTGEENGTVPVIIRSQVGR